MSSMASDEDGTPVIIYATPNCRPGEFWWNCDPMPPLFPAPKVWFQMEFLEKLIAGTAPNGGGSWSVRGDDYARPLTLSWTSRRPGTYIWLLPYPPIMHKSARFLRLGHWPD